MRIADDIIQVPLPLPFALRIVNCYLIRGDEGWTVIDSGLGTADGRAGWQAAFTEYGLAPGDLHQIVLTHFHPDHYGMAGWLQQWSGAPVLMAPREAELARLVWQHPDGEREPMFELFTSYGSPLDLAEAMAAQVRSLRHHTSPHPQITPLEPGSTLRLGNRTVRAIQTPGHSDGHLIFYDEAERLVFCGDQVLIKITPNIGLWPESEPDPLGRYLASLHSIADIDVRLALPGHGPLIEEWRGRINQLIHHHDERLATMYAAVGAGASAYEVARQAFNFERLTHHEMRFAVAETVAHLEFMVARGQLSKAFHETWIFSKL